MLRGMSFTLIYPDTRCTLHVCWHLPTGPLQTTQNDVYIDKIFTPTFFVGGTRHLFANDLTLKNIVSPSTSFTSIGTRPRIASRFQEEGEPGPKVQRVETGNFVVICLLLHLIDKMGPGISRGELIPIQV